MRKEDNGLTEAQEKSYYGQPLQYVKKPVVISAMEYRGFDENGEACEVWLGDSFMTHLPSQNQIVISTLEGETTASRGDFIIKGIEGEFYPCKPDIFEATYEPV